MSLDKPKQEGFLASDVEALKRSISNNLRYRSGQDSVDGNARGLVAGFRAGGSQQACRALAEIEYGLL